MPLRHRRRTKSDWMAADILHSLGSSRPQASTPQAPEQLSSNGQEVFQRVQQKAWWLYWSSPETCSSAGVTGLVCLGLSQGDPALKKLVKKSDVYALGDHVGLARADVDLMMKKASNRDRHEPMAGLWCCAQVQDMQGAISVELMLGNCLRWTRNKSHAN